MNGQLKASLIVKFAEDGLTAGLGKLEKQLDRLQDLAKSLGLSKLEQGLEELRGSSGVVDQVTEKLRGTETQADKTASAIKRVAAANDNLAAGGAGRPGSLDFGLATAGRRLAGAGRGVVGAGKHFGEAASQGVNGLIGAGVEAFAVYEPIKAYAEYENTLRHIAITEKKSGAAVDAEIKRLTDLFAADALETGQSSRSIADAYSDLVQTGIPSSVLDTAIQAHSKAATAYNVSPEAMGPAVGALLQNLKIPESELGSALAAMAQASKEGRFKIEDFSRQLPGISGQMALLGMTGRKSADIAFAGLETVMKNSGEPNQAAVDLYDALHYITSPIAKRSFAKEGIDLPGLLSNAQKKGINPLDAVLGKLDSRIQGKGPVEAAEYLGKLLHNQQAGQAVLSLLQHKTEFLELRKLLDGVNATSLNTDFITAFAAPTVQLRIFNEELSQVTRILGEGFAPTMQVVNIGLLYLLKGLTWMNSNMPQTLHWVLGIVAGMLALGAALTVLGVIAPVMAAGWGLLTAVFGGLISVFLILVSPIGLVVAAVAALGAVAYDIYANWAKFESFFVALWDGVKQTFSGFVTFVSGVFTGDLSKALDGLSTMIAGVHQIFVNMWEIMKRVFLDFVAWVDGWTDDLATRLGQGIERAIKGAFQGVQSWLPKFVVPNEGLGFEGNEGLSPFDKLTSAPQLKAPENSSNGGHSAITAPPTTTTVGGEVRVKVDGPGTATATSDNPRIPLILQPNAGRVLNRDSGR